MSPRLSSSNPRRAFGRGSLFTHVVYELQRAKIARDDNKVSWLQRWTGFQADLGAELRGRACLLSSKNSKTIMYRKQSLDEDASYRPKQAWRHDYDGDPETQRMRRVGKEDAS